MEEKKKVLTADQYFASLRLEDIEKRIAADPNYFEIEGDIFLDKKLLNTWYKPLKRFKCVELMEGIMQSMNLLYENTVVHPAKNKVFRAFKENTYDDCRVVFLGQDPYHNLHKGSPNACGIAFATETGYVNPSLKNIYKEMNVDLGVTYNKTQDSTLPIEWNKNGVLMLNTSLTVEEDLPGSHIEVWNEWTKRLISGLIEHRKDLVWILLGKKAFNLFTAANNGSTTDKCIVASHPSPYSANLGFIGSKIFSRTNSLLRDMDKKEIQWIKQQIIKDGK